MVGQKDSEATGRWFKPRYWLYSSDFINFMSETIAKNNKFSKNNSTFGPKTCRGNPQIKSNASKSSEFESQLCFLTFYKKIYENTFFSNIKINSALRLFCAIRAGGADSGHSWLLITMVD